MAEVALTVIIAVAIGAALGAVLWGAYWAIVLRPIIRRTQAIRKCTEKKMAALRRDYPEYWR